MNIYVLQNSRTVLQPGELRVRGFVSSFNSAEVRRSGRAETRSRLRTGNLVGNGTESHLLLGSAGKGKRSAGSGSLLGVLVGAQTDHPRRVVGCADSKTSPILSAADTAERSVSCGEAPIGTTAADSVIAGSTVSGLSVPTIGASENFGSSLMLVSSVTSNSRVNLGTPSKSASMLDLRTSAKDRSLAHRFSKLPVNTVVKSASVRSFSVMNRTRTTTMEFVSMLCKWNDVHHCLPDSQTLKSNICSINGRITRNLHDAVI
jgi:hypothetical protein